MPDLDPADLDGTDRMALHAAILQRKKLLLQVFHEFHHIIVDLDKRHFSDTGGMTIELGSGIAPIRDSYPHVLCTDIVPHSGLDMTLDAQCLALDDGSVHAIYGQNFFHHLSDPARFFEEALRVLRPGGGIILIEPYYGAAASWIYPRLFTSESFDKSAQNWQTQQTGPMIGANQALSYMVFVRDREVFERRFPQLEIRFQNPLNSYLRYLLSGGLNFRALAPVWMAGGIQGVEAILRPAARLFALHHVVVLRKQ